jgi:hypothetical protein
MHLYIEVHGLYGQSVYSYPVNLNTESRKRHGRVISKCPGSNLEKTKAENELVFSSVEFKHAAEFCN